MSEHQKGGPAPIDGITDEDMAALRATYTDEGVALVLADLRNTRAERDRYREENERLREAVARHARTLDGRALGHPDHIKRDRDDIDNEMYNVVRASDPAWWDREVPGLNGSGYEAGKR